MSISIVACPKCGTFLLSETAQCHRCRHVLNAEQAVKLRQNSLPTDQAIQDDSERCRQCGETCRKGLVRCWSCGAFTRPEIEEAYYRMLQEHGRGTSMAGQKLELPEITEAEARKRFIVDDEELKPSTHLAPLSPEESALDEDFEFEGEFRLMEDPASDSPAPIPLSLGSDKFGADKETGETYALKTPSPEPTDAPKTAETAGPAANSAPAAEKKPDDSDDEATKLLKGAKEEETHTQKARRAKLGEGFVVYCPMGCKIRVQERHRGKMGRCPKCQATFFVPLASQTAVSGALPASAAEGSAPSVPENTRYSRWIPDVHLHRVAPQKLRIKADSLLKDFQEVDVGFDPAGLLLVGLKLGGGGMFGGGKNAKKKDPARTAVQDHLKTKPTLEGLPNTFLQELAPEAVRQISLSQPTPPGSESLWGEILVFGAGRIAVRLPKIDEKTTAYLSFSLSEFRQFSECLQQYFGIENFGAGTGVPLKDEYRTDACFVTKKLVKELQNLAYYQKDPAIKLDVAGYRCKICSAVISEAARAVQKLGGANAKGIAKAKCPKCTKPLGNQPLYVMPTTSAPKPEAAAEATPGGDAAEADKSDAPAEQAAV